LETDYLDAYLLHWPNSQIPIEETLGALQELVQAKKIRHIGLSNVTVNHLKRALELKIPITWVQIEMNPDFYDPALLNFCKEHSIMVQAWSPLGSGSVCKDEMLAKVGQKYDKTPSQVAIRWIIQHGCMPLPKSTNEERIGENIQVNDFTLSEEEMQEIDERAADGTRRRYSKEFLGFSDEFDLSYEECWPMH
jgi:diketogulonate reductase-like aldo/keto reductase